MLKKSIRTRSAVGRAGRSVSNKKRSWVPLFVATGVLCIVAFLIVIHIYAPNSLSSACLPFESYDWQVQSCYATCKDSASCTTLDQEYAQADAVRTNEQNKIYFDFSTTPIETPLGGFAPADSAAYTVYTIEDGKLGNTIESSSTPELRQHDAHTWEMISAIMPHSVMSRITQFVGYTDDLGSTSALAAPTDETSQKWSISVNDVGFYSSFDAVIFRGDAIHTLVHEIGHIITLGGSFESNSVSICQTFTIGGGCKNTTPPCATFTMHEDCVRTDSIVAQYAKEFWPASYKNGGDVPAELKADQFVSSYAATNLAEDMAESWTAFVLLDKPTGNTIADKKVLFFYTFPKFVEARAEIRKHLSHVH